MKSKKGIVAQNKGEEPSVERKRLGSAIMCVLAFVKSESVARYGPEDECQSRTQYRHKDDHPNSTTEKKLLHVRLTDGERPEGGRLGLEKENEDRILFILVRY